jgi:hypothetical protein
MLEVVQQSLFVEVMVGACLVEISLPVEQWLRLRRRDNSLGHCDGLSQLVVQV